MNTLQSLLEYASQHKCSAASAVVRAIGITEQSVPDDIAERCYHAIQAIDVQIESAVAHEAIQLKLQRNIISRTITELETEHAT